MTEQAVIGNVVDAVSGVLQGQEHPVLLHAPSIPPAGWEYLKDCLDTGWISSAGRYVTRFEEILVTLTGARRAVATVNGTAALQVALTLAGVEADDEVLVPSLTFVATANAVRHCNAIPHFVDVNVGRMSVDPELLANHLKNISRPTPKGLVNRETGRPIRALCVMHCLGHPADLEGLVDVCNRYNIVLVEDAAESAGSWYDGRHTGNHGQIAVLSFNGNKIVSTGGGGAILTNNDELADRARHLTTTGKVAHPWEFIHDEVAWNYRMPNINAALGCAQLEQLPRLLEAKRLLAGSYEAAFNGVEGVTFLKEPHDSRSNYWLNAIVLNQSYVEERDTILEALNSAGFQSRALWRPMHLLPMYEECPRADLSVTEDLYRRVINIPSSAHLAPGWSDSSTDIAVKPNGR